jgi:hypothetical protein
MGMDSYLKDILKKDKKDRTAAEQEALNKGMLNLTGQKAGNFMQGAGMFGNLMQATSAMPGQEPNVKQSAIGGALSGMSTGMAFGPIGALLGAGIGGLTGFMSGSKNLEEHLLQMNQEQNANIASKTIQPTMYKKGGQVSGRGVQTDIGEVVLLPGVLELVMTASSKRHEDMEDDELTDFLPDGSIVFSDRKTFNPEAIEDKVIGYGPGHYSENKTYAPEKIVIGDIFGDKEITFAEAAKKLKTAIKVTDGKTKDIFDDKTDAENKLTRMMYLQELISSQGAFDPMEDKSENESEDSIPKFAGGGTVGGYADILRKKLQELAVSKKAEMEANKGVGEGVSADYYKNVYKKLQELRDRNQTELVRGKEDVSDLSKKMRGSVLAQAGMSNLFTGLQSPITRPVVQDNTFIEDAYQQIPLSQIESQVAPIRGSVNSMAQMLLSSGVNPSQVPAMLATTQGRALDAEGQMRANFIQDRINTDRGKYQALRQNLTTNKSNIVAAENATTEGYNQRFAQFGDIMAQMMGQGRELTAGKVQAGRSLDKSYLDNDISLFRTESDIAGNRMEFDDRMNRINDRLNQLRAENSRLSSQIDRRNMYHTGIGVDENGYTVNREIPNQMNFMGRHPNSFITAPQRGVPPINVPIPDMYKPYENPFDSLWK